MPNSVPMRLLIAFLGFCLMLAGPLVDTTYAQCSPDVTKPVIVDMPNDTTQTAEPGACGAFMDWDIPSATDNCELFFFNSNHAVGDFFGVGITTVTYTAQDTSGNMKASSFFITITDDQNPGIIGLPSDTTILVIPGTCAATYSWTEPTATDNCEISSFTSDGTNGASFNKGTNTVTYTAMDVNGNDSIASFSIHLKLPTSTWAPRWGLCDLAYTLKMYVQYHQRSKSIVNQGTK